MTSYIKATVIIFCLWLAVDLPVVCFPIHNDEVHGESGGEADSAESNDSGGDSVDSGDSADSGESGDGGET